MPYDSRPEVALLIILFIQTASAIEIGFSAEDGGDSVSLTDEYYISDGLSLTETAEASFEDTDPSHDPPNKVQITDDRQISGAGDIEMYQGYSGSGGYFGDSGIYAVDVTGAAGSHAQLSARSLNVRQSASLEGIFADLMLYLDNHGQQAITESFMDSGLLSTDQGISTGSAQAWQNTHIDALFGFAGAGALSADLDGQSVMATTISYIRNGDMTTNQYAKSDGAFAGQNTNFDALAGFAVSDISSTDLAGQSRDAVTESLVINGRMTTDQYARSGSASAGQKTSISGMRGLMQSRSNEWNENGQLVENWIFTEIEDGSLLGDQYVQVDPDQSLSYQSVMFDASRVSGQAAGMRFQSGGVYDVHRAGTMFDGSGHVTGMTEDGAIVNDISTEAYQWLIAGTGSDNDAYFEANAEAGWLVPESGFVSGLSRRGAWADSQIGPDSAIYQYSAAYSDNDVAQAIFLSNQLGAGTASAVAGRYLAVWAGNPWFPGITPLPDSITDSMATGTGDWILGYAQETPDGSNQIAGVQKVI